MIRDTEYNRLKMLVLEDSLADFELITELLSDAGYILDLTHVENESGFTAKLKENYYDIILSDFKLPGFDAFGALEISRQVCPDVPFICVSGSIGEDTAIELLKLGAVDYVLKDRPERLPFSVNRALNEAKEKLAYHKAEELIRLFSLAVESSSISVIITDVRGNIIYVNPFFTTLTGYSTEEVIGKDTLFLDSGKNSKDFYEKLGQTVLAGMEWSGEVLNKKKNGEFYWANGYVSPLTNDSGEITHFVSIMEDVTERKRMLEELVLAKEKAEENDKLKTAFINNISHEIRTPLNGILGFSRLLSDDDLPADKRTEYYSIVKESGERLLNTVSNYMDMAMIVSGTMKMIRKEFTLIPLFEEIMEEIAPLCDAKKIKLTIGVSEKDAGLTINSDRNFIYKILRILLYNAVKFTRDGSITYGYRTTAGNLEMYVQDSGVGISQDKFKRIFEIFTQEETADTRGYDGSGLGLNIASGLIGLLGGNISVISDKGKGSTFTCVIPVDVKKHQSF